MPLEGMGELKLCGLLGDPQDLDLSRWMIPGKKVSLVLVDCSTINANHDEECRGMETET